MAIVASPSGLHPDAAAALSNHGRFDVIVSEKSLDECRLRIGAGDPDVVLIAGMNGTTDRALDELRRYVPRASVVVCGETPGDDPTLRWGDHAGVLSFVTRRVSAATLVAVVEAAARGEVLRAAMPSEKAAPHVAQVERPGSAIGVNLSAREREILSLMPTHSNKAIAYRLDIKLSTAKNHVHSILSKLHLRRRSDAARVAALLRDDGAERKI